MKKIQVYLDDSAMADLDDIIELMPRELPKKVSTAIRYAVIRTALAVKTEREKAKNEQG